jgi:hypothetical protein
MIAILWAGQEDIDRAWPNAIVDWDAHFAVDAQTT